MVALGYLHPTTGKRNKRVMGPLVDFKFGAVNDTP